VRDTFGSMVITDMRWCTVSEPEQRKCAELAKALVAVLPPVALSIWPSLSCVKAYDALRSAILSCQDNKADLVTLDAGEVYSAQKHVNVFLFHFKMFPSSPRWLYSCSCCGEEQQYFRYALFAGQ
uniref:Zgc:172271 n=1 Tax=Sinocyclocheilus anshuiensis TaxID=1608454 RepID=A0A671QNV7_9TELE